MFFLLYQSNHELEKEKNILAQSHVQYLFTLLLLSCYMSSSFPGIHCGVGATGLTDPLRQDSDLVKAAMVPQLIQNFLENLSLFCTEMLCNSPKTHNRLSCKSFSIPSGCRPIRICNNSYIYMMYKCILSTCIHVRIKTKQSGSSAGEGHKTKTEK